MNHDGGFCVGDWVHTRHPVTDLAQHEHPPGTALVIESAHFGARGPIVCATPADWTRSSHDGCSLNGASYFEAATRGHAARWCFLADDLYVACFGKHPAIEAMLAHADGSPGDSEGSLYDLRMAAAQEVSADYRDALTCDPRILDHYEGYTFERVRAACVRDAQRSLISWQKEDEDRAAAEAL